MTTNSDKRFESKSISSTSSARVVNEYDTPEDRKLVRTIDLRLLPILTLLYLLSFLDRSNIGNAKIVGLTTDLHISGPDYNNALALYFVAYVVFEVPSNIILKRFDPQFWLPTLTLLWGIVSVCQGLVVNRTGLFIIRIFLGATEAGLFPGVVFLFSIYYRRNERSWRVAIFFGGAALAGAFGGILAYGIEQMNGVGGKKGWNWIFILEGILTVVISVIAYFWVPTWPQKAKFLTERERERLLERLQADSDAGKNERFEWFFVRQAFKDHLVWGYALAFHGFAFVLYSLSLFMPTIIANLGFQSWQAQLMTVPPNALASLSIWGGVWLSAHYKLRAPFIIGAATIAILGYIILLASTTAGGQYVGVHLAAAGVYTGNALLLSWPGENVSGQTKRAVAVAMQITIGDIGAIAGVLIYRPSLAAHRFRTPHIIAIGYLVFAILIALYLSTWMSRENKRRGALLGEGKQDPPPPLELDEQQKLGDRDVHYRYVV